MSDQDNPYLGIYNDQSKDEQKCLHSTSIKTPPSIIPTTPTITTTSSAQVTTPTTNKQKNKPGPLHIPSDISAFQKQQQQQEQLKQQLLPPPQIPPYYQHQHSYQSSLSSYVYPNATLLKSPRLVNYDVKKQYTPPPMLSPFRKRPGLFYNYLTSILMMQQQQHQQQQNRHLSGAPVLNHSMSCSAYMNAPAVFYSLLANNFTAASASSSNDYMTNLNSSITNVTNNSSNNQDINTETREEDVNCKISNKNNTNNQEKTVLLNKEKETNTNKELNSNNTSSNTSNHKASAFTPKPGLLRQRLCKCFFYH